MQTVFFCFRFLCSWVEIFEWNKPQTISLIILILILFVIKCPHVFWRRSMDSLYCNQYTVYLFVYSCVWSEDSDGMSFQYRRLSGFLSFSGIFKMFVKKKNNGFFNQCDYTFEGGANMIFRRGRLLQRLIHSKEHNWMFFSQPVPSSYHEEITCTIATRTLRPFFLNSLMTVSTKSLLFLVHKPARGYFLLTL